MKMKPIDVMGSLYSEGGLRFGGIETLDFLNATEQLEKKNPGIRERIIAEAHYLVFWLHKFPEIAFLFGITFYKSFWIALVLFILAFIFEIIRFYVFRASPFISQMCRIWNLIKIPIFIITAINIWPENNFLSIILMIFLIIQGLFDIISSVVMLPIRLIFSSIIYKKYGGEWNNIEAMAINFVIKRWQLKFFPADRFNDNR